MVSTTLIDLLKRLSFLGTGREIRPCPVQAIYTPLYSIPKNAFFLSDEGILSSPHSRLVVVWRFSANQHYDFVVSVVVVWQFSANQHYDFVVSVVVVVAIFANQHYNYIASVVVVWRFYANQHYGFVISIVVVWRFSANQHYDRAKNANDGRNNLEKNWPQNWPQNPKCG